MTAKKEQKLKSRLGSVKTGKIDKPLRCCLYGAEAVGKTTLAGHSPKPIFIDIENGSSQLDVARYTFDDSGRVVPKNFKEVVDALTDLLINDHDYKTVVIDSLSRLEGLIWDHCIKRDSRVKSELNPGGNTLLSIESYGWGKGYNAAFDVFRGVIARLELLWERRGMNIIIIGHQYVKLFKNPGGDDYDRYWLHAHEKISGLVKKWTDVVGFCHFEEFSRKLEDGDSDHTKGFSTGRRVMSFEREAAFDAKSRFPMPKEIAMELGDPWGPFQDAIDLGRKLDIPELAKCIKAELKRINDPQLTSKVMGLCQGAQDTAMLNRYRIRLTEMKTKEAGEQDNE